MTSHRNYAEIFVDFEEWQADHPFFRLGDEMAQPFNRRLGRRKAGHRWGVLSLLFKQKVFDAWQRGEIACWEEVRWRAIVSYANNCWRSWYAHAGKTVQLLAMFAYPLGNMVQSEREVQRKLRRLNRVLERRTRDGYEPSQIR